MVREKPAQPPPYPAEKARGGEIILRRPLAAHRFHSRGRKATSYRSIKTDVINADAKWEDSPVVVDQGVITSRQPGEPSPRKSSRRSPRAGTPSAARRPSITPRRGDCG
jgi:DJ-1/PfpI family